MMTIYSVGDVWYLGKVLDAIAMVTGADGGLKQASAVAALLGVIIICFQSVIRNQGINIQHMVVCYIIYMMCFGFTTSVAIESAYSDKQVIQKDNVPYGPAVMGYVVSQLGYKLTRKMEQAFQDIDDNQKMTNQGTGGYLNALYLIENLGRIAEDGTIARAINAVDPDFQSNFLRYTSECTLKGMYYGSSRGGMDWQILQTKGVWDAIFFDSDWYTTEFRNHGVSEVLNCTDAHGKLKKQWDNAIVELQSGKASDEVKNIAMRLGQCNSKGECSNQTDFLIKTDSDALKTLFNAQTKAQDFVLAGYADNLIKTGLADGFTFMGNANSAAMMLQAINQRQTQWAAEQNMFLKSMRPMMSFVEGFFYAIAPFASIILMLGLLGLNIFFKYLILLVWVQLWLPVMSIANMFISVRANAFLSNLPIPKDGSSSTVSLYVYETAIDGVREYIASGAMFMAATPLLTFIIISGSAYAMTSLTGRMSGGDFVNEKMVSPDIASPAAAMGMQSRYNGNPNTGVWGNGVIDRDIGFGNSLQAEMASLNSQMTSKSNTVNTTFKQAYSDSYGSTQMSSKDFSDMQNSNFMTSDAAQRMMQATKNLTHALGIGQTLSDSQRMAVGLAAGLKIGTGIDVSSDVTSSWSTEQKDLYQAMTGDSSVIGSSDMQTVTGGTAVAFGDRMSKAKVNSKVSSEMSELSRQGADLMNTAKQYSEAEKAVKFFQNNLKGSEMQLLGQALQSNDNKTKELLDNILEKHGLKESRDNYWKEHYATLEQQYGPEAYSYAAVETIMGSNNSKAASEVAMGLFKLTGHSTPDLLGVSANKYKGIVSQDMVGSGSVGFDYESYKANKESVGQETSKVSEENMSSRFEDKKGQNITKGENIKAQAENEANANKRIDATNHFRTNKMYQDNGYNNKNAAQAAKSFFSGIGKIVMSEFNNDYEKAANAFSDDIISKYDLSNTKGSSQAALADYLGAEATYLENSKEHKAPNQSGGLIAGSLDEIKSNKQKAIVPKSFLDQKKQAFIDAYAKDINATSNIPMDEAKEKATKFANYLNSAIIGADDEKSFALAVKEIKTYSAR